MSDIPVSPDVACFLHRFVERRESFGVGCGEQLSTEFFGKVVKGGNLRLHPVITKLVDEDTQKKLGAEKMGAGA